MRIRLKKGVALFGTIAGAAVAAILIAYNANQGNFVNISDIDEAGIIDLSGALESGQSPVSPQPSVVADASGAAAVAAGLIGGDLTDSTEVSADDVQSEAHVSADKDSEEGAGAVETGTVYNSEGSSVVSGEDTASSEGFPSDEQGVVYTGQVQTYVEVVPRTRTETVVNRRDVTVETPVTVTEQVLVETEVTGDFHARSDSASSAEISSGRRAEEAAATQDLINKNLEAAADKTGELDYMTGDMVGRDYDVIVFE